MKTFYILFISLLFFSNTFSQNSEYEVNVDSSSIMSTPSFSIHKNNFNTIFFDRIHLSFQTGISFYSLGKHSIFDEWFAPAISYNLTSKFHATIGTMAIFNKPGYFQNSVNNEGNKTFFKSISGQYFLFAQGEYLLNSRITLRGMILREVPQNSINPYSLNINRVGVDFKIFDRLSISADFIKTNGYNSYFMRNNSEFNFPENPLSGNFFYNRTW